MSKFWKDGVWITDSSIPRTEMQKEDDKILAKEVFVDGRIFDIEAISRVVGKNNVEQGLIRLFNLMQHRELNRNFLVNIVQALFEEALQ